jgi:hypothetical protein
MAGLGLFVGKGTDLIATDLNELVTLRKMFPCISVPYNIITGLVNIEVVLSQWAEGFIPRGKIYMSRNFSRQESNNFNLIN